jgi:hypothetical protein
MEGATSSKKIPDRLVGDCLRGMNHSYSIGSSIIRSNFLFILTEFTASAKKCHETAVRGENFYLVLRGAALSDLPDVESEIDLYRKVVCPVLILTVEGDDSHPVSTANALHSVLPTSILHVAADKKSAMRDWPDVISSFLLLLP